MSILTFAWIRRRHRLWCACTTVRSSTETCSPEEVLEIRERVLGRRCRSDHIEQPEHVVLVQQLARLESRIARLVLVRSTDRQQNESTHLLPVVGHLLQVRRDL